MAFPPSSLFQEAEYVRPSLNFEPMEIEWGRRAWVHSFSLDNIALAMVGTQ